MIIPADGSNFSPIPFPLINSSLPSEKLLAIREAYLLQTWDSILLCGVNEATAGVFSCSRAAPGDNDIAAHFRLHHRAFDSIKALWVLVIRLCQQQPEIFPEQFVCATRPKPRRGPARVWIIAFRFGPGLFPPTCATAWKRAEFCQQSGLVFTFAKSATAAAC